MQIKNKLLVICVKVTSQWNSINTTSDLILVRIVIKITKYNITSIHNLLNRNKSTELYYFVVGFENCEVICSLFPLSLWTVKSNDIIYEKKKWNYGMRWDRH